MEFELESSLRYHQNSTPLLVSSQLLRRYGCGQLDLAVIVKNGGEKNGYKIILMECKRSMRISARQLERLKRSGLFLGSLFTMPVQLKILSRSI